MSARTSRRRLFGSAAAVALVGALPATAATPHPDADLIHLCAEFDALERKMQAGPPAGLKFGEDEIWNEAIFAPQRILLDLICAARCTTLEGMRARARTFALWQEDDPSFSPDSGYWDDRMGFALMRDLAAAPVASSSPCRDADLVRTAAAMVATWGEVDRISTEYDDFVRRPRHIEAQIATLVGQHHERRAELSAMQATTMAGFTAKARALMVQFSPGDWRLGPDPEDDHYLAWTLCRDLLEVAGA